MRRLLRWLGYQFACAAVWCNGAAAKISSTEGAAMLTGPGKPARFPPAIVDSDKPLNFSMQPVEFQRMAVGCLHTLAPMRPRKARA